MSDEAEDARTVSASSWAMPLSMNFSVSTGTGSGEGSGDLHSSFASTIDQRSRASAPASSPQKPKSLLDSALAYESEDGTPTMFGMVAIGGRANSESDPSLVHSSKSMDLERNPEMKNSNSI